MIVVTPVPCYRDNYAYLVGEVGSDRVVIVDACETAPIVEALEARGLVPVAILSTHHHPDHVGANLEFVARFGLPVYGHSSEKGRIPGLTHALEHGGSFAVESREFSVLHVPGHTRGAICYVTDGRAFTGDTLFCGGSGRLFEGTAAEMDRSLRAIASLGPDVLVYTGHEYTESNLRFAAALLPEDERIRARLEEVVAKRALGQVTAIAPVAMELETNLFLRVAEERVASALGLVPGTPREEVLAALRDRKNRS